MEFTRNLTGWPLFLNCIMLVTLQKYSRQRHGFAAKVTNEQTRHLAYVHQGPEESFSLAEKQSLYQADSLIISSRLGDNHMDELHVRDRC